MVIFEVSTLWPCEVLHSFEQKRCPPKSLPRPAGEHPLPKVAGIKKIYLRWGQDIILSLNTTIVGGPFLMISGCRGLDTNHRSSCIGNYLLHEHLTGKNDDSDAHHLTLTLNSSRFQYYLSLEHRSLTHWHDDPFFRPVNGHVFDWWSLGFVTGGLSKCSNLRSSERW